MSRFSDSQHIYHVATRKLDNKVLNEFYHIIETFGKCTNYLVNHINEYSEKYKYTGWNFISDRRICVELKDKTVKYPIYLRVKEDFNDINLYSIADRTEKNKNINKILLTVNTAYKSDLYNGFGHEFSHAFDMYLKDFNLIAKETIIDDNNELAKKLNFNDSTLNELNGLLYCIMPSEQRGHINGTIQYLKNHFSELLYMHFSDMVEYSYDTNMLLRFSRIYDELCNKTEYYFQTPINQLNNQPYKSVINKFYRFAYFCKTHANLKIKNINEKQILNLNNISIEEKLEVIKDMVNKISDNYKQYKQKIYDVIYVHAYEPVCKYRKEHNMYITTNEIY